MRWVGGWCVVGGIELRVDGEKEFLGATDWGFMYTPRAGGVRLGSRKGWIASTDHMGY